MEQRFRIGAVSFFNTRPLICGLDEVAAVEVIRRPPAELADLLDSGAVDVALTPSIDFQLTEREWTILPVGAIGSLGEVLTVRVFSSVPFEQVSLLRCDVHSHTSVALARLVWRLRYVRDVGVRPYHAAGGGAGAETDGPDEQDSAVLLIGDKVLEHLGRWAFELDLGQAWTELTGLPFVYAFWAMRSESLSKAEALTGLLRGALARGQSELAALSRRYGGEHGFTEALAARYFSENVRFDLGQAQCAALERFYELAEGQGITERCRPVRLYGQAGECSAVTGEFSTLAGGDTGHD